MSNIFDFLEKNGVYNFEEAEFNPVDAMVLSQLTYLNYDAAFLGRKFDNAPLSFSKFVPYARTGQLFKGIRAAKQCEQLFYAFIKSRRYKDVSLSCFINVVDTESEKQFCAMVFNLPDGTDFVGFRGTDNTLIGWKEDFNMTFMSAIPAQIDAVAYLNKAAMLSDKALRVGGHSKGGNLAVYSSAKCCGEIKNRIIDIYNFDGPGFRKEFLCDPDFTAMKDRVRKYLPQSSIVGMLMYSEETYTVIRSDRKGIMQHDLFSWQIEDGMFVTEDSIKVRSMLLDRTVADWLSSLEDEQRKIFIDTVFDLVRHTNARTVLVLNAQKRKNTAILLEAVRGIDSEKRRFILKVFGSLFKFAPKVYKDHFTEWTANTKTELIAKTKLIRVTNHRKDGMDE